LELSNLSAEFLVFELEFVEAFEGAFVATFPESDLLSENGIFALEVGEASLELCDVLSQFRKRWLRGVQLVFGCKQESVHDSDSLRIWNQPTREMYQDGFREGLLPTLIFSESVW
jgi:hypothetical protein